MNVKTVTPGIYVLYHWDFHHTFKYFLGFVGFWVPGGHSPTKSYSRGERLSPYGLPP